MDCLKNWLEDSRRCCKHSSVIWHIWNQILTLFTRCYSRRFLQLSIVPPMSSSAAVANGFTYYAFQRCYAAYLGNVWLLESVLLSYQLKAGWPYCSYLWLQLGFFAQSTVTHWSDSFFLDLFGSFSVNPRDVCAAVSQLLRPACPPTTQKSNSCKSNCFLSWMLGLNLSRSLWLQA